MKDIRFKLEGEGKINKGYIFTMSGVFERLTIKQWFLQLFGVTPIRTHKKFVVTEDCTSEAPFIPYKEL